MTDTATASPEVETHEPGTPITASMDTARDMLAQIAKIDETIDAASGSADAGKRRIANEYSETYKDSFSETVDSVVQTLLAIEELPVLIGAVTSLNRNITENFRKNMDTFLEAEVEKRKTDAPEVSQSELDEAIAARKNLVGKFHALKNLLEMWGDPVDQLGPGPKKWTGARGEKRGPRLPAGIQFAIDGTDRTESQNSLSSIYSTVCKDISAWNSTKDLKDWLKKEGFDFEHVPSEFSYKLPNGKVLSGKLNVSLSDDEEEEENEEEEVEESDPTSGE